MKIGVFGTRGIPNHHGGFEQFTEYFAVFAKNQGHEVYVYNSSTHPFKEKSYKGVHIIHCFDPEKLIGTAGQFIYDLNCIIDSRKRKFDIILQLGYTSSSIWGRLLPKSSVIVTNMDGLEWKRSKYSKKVQKFLLQAESWAVKTSDLLISDSKGIQKYLEEKYKVRSKFIAYGADIFKNPKKSFIKPYGLKENEYFTLIARIEPENNIEMILDGYVHSKSNLPMCVIGNIKATSFGAYLEKKFSKHKNIKFLGAIYDINILNNIRHFSRLYFHGHSVGGTNPSLLEAMASGALIAAHKNIFNEAILEDRAFYFESVDEVEKLIATIQKKNFQNKIVENLNKIESSYNWDIINREYLSFLIESYNGRKE